jgi:hypothetical protein
MRTQFSKIALAAALGLAITFTLSCSSDDGGSGATPSSSSRSSSSKAVVQEYCVYKNHCGVIEPKGKDYTCKVGTKMDYCPYDYKKMNLDTFNTCLNYTCSYMASNSMSSLCSTCGGFTANAGGCAGADRLCR